MIDLTRYMYMLPLLIIAGTVTAIAQPSPNQLADRMYEINQQRLSNIETLTLTMKMDMAGFESETTTRYIKTESDGRVILVPDDRSENPDSELLEGVYDGSIEEIIRAGESVSNDRVDGINTYKILITDTELLNRLGRNEFDADDAEIEIERATLWIDSNELLPVRMLYDQFADGSGISIEIVMEDFRTYSGLPVSHKMLMKMEGMDSMFSEEEIAEARQAMREMEEQLAAMPPAQREMIESRMSGQIEQFEQMIESGSGGTTLMEVVDVQVNE